MFSVLALRTGTFGRVAVSQNASKILAVVPQRQISKLEEDCKRWDKANAIFYGPERDKVNFPHPVMPETCPKTQFGFLPDSWFQFFYPKTGVTGPYMFGFGLLTYLISKEIWVIDHGFGEVVGFTGAMYIAMKYGGPILSKYLDSQCEKGDYESFVKPIEQAKADSQRFIKIAEENIERAKGQAYVFEAKHENVDLQLEAAYRQRLNSIYQDVKRRLDYQLDVQTAKRSFEQRHMVNWIVDSVRKGITAQQEKESLKSCLQTLKNLSQKQATAAV